MNFSKQNIYKHANDVNEILKKYEKVDIKSISM